MNRRENAQGIGKVTTGATAIPGPGTPRGEAADWAALALPAILVAAAVAAYGRTLSVPFLFDDVPSIADNPTIRHLSGAFWPPADSTVGGRPVLNLSLAFDYAVSGTGVWSYHATNVAIHTLAGLALYGVARRTLAALGSRSATAVAFSAALLWVVHPLQTESVTYVIQRAESLMALFYLLTLYAFIRAAGSAGRAARAWSAACVGACLLGMATKEVMVSAPLIVLLYDRTFASGSFREALGRRAALYGCLAATWPVLALLVLSTHGRGGTVGFASGVSWWGYALAQFPALVHYLRLCVWPRPLIFDYGHVPAPPSLATALDAAVVIGLLGATAWALVRRPALGFLGACFFAILAPSSSVVPVATEVMAEHRMYLPLAAATVLAAVAMDRWIGRLLVAATLALAAALLAATWQRNGAYRSALSLWSDVAAKAPGNDRAQFNLGCALVAQSGRLQEAAARFEEAIRLNPNYVEAHYNLGKALKALGRTREAIAQFEEALRLNSDVADAHFSLASALQEDPSRLDDAVAQFQQGLRLKPDVAEAHMSLGAALQRTSGRLNDAVAQYEEAIRLNPGLAEAHFRLGTALQALPGRLGDAVSQYEEAIRLRPDFADAHYNLGCILVAEPGRTADAIAQYDEALRLKPGMAEAHCNLGYALAKVPGRLPEAIAQYEEALRLRPDYAEAHCNLGNALSTSGRAQEAIPHYEQALRTRPDDPVIHIDLAIALLKVPGRTDEAVAQLNEALRLQPGNPMARQILSGIGATAQ